MTQQAKTRGRKTRPQIDLYKPMTPAAKKRWHVYCAAHSARLHHDRAKAAGRQLSWAKAIEMACKKINAVHGDIVTEDAVERQIFPRSRDRINTEPTVAFEVVIRQHKHKKV